jgi:hypothetical protein
MNGYITFHHTFFAFHSEKQLETKMKELQMKKMHEIKGDEIITPKYKCYKSGKIYSIDDQYDIVPNATFDGLIPLINGYDISFQKIVNVPIICSSYRIVNDKYLFNSTLKYNSDCISDLEIIFPFKLKSDQKIYIKQYEIKHDKTEMVESNIVISSLNINENIVKVIPENKIINMAGFKGGTKIFFEIDIDDVNDINKILDDIKFNCFYYYADTHIRRDLQNNVPIDLLKGIF